MEIKVILPECSDDPVSDWLRGLTREICKLTGDVYMAREQREAYERLRRDAWRYRWLRDQNNSEAVEDMICVYNYGDNAALLDGEELDAAIDVKMRE